ncbi:MAG: YfhO family protein [Planctomycetes bacterium]|nr:YfhO family protein [Planctomycetota bacterium]
MRPSPRLLHFLLAIGIGLFVQRRLLLDEILVVLPIAIGSLLLAAGLTALRCRDQAEEETTTADPIERLRGARLGLFVVALGGVILVFGDVLVCGRTMISAPWFSLGNEGAATTEGQSTAGQDAGAGFDRLIDPWAGFLIEGPAIYLTGTAFARGELPLWNPFEGCGTPFAADLETAVFSVLQLPLHLAPSLRNWDLFALARTLLAIWFAALACRGLGSSRLAAALAGIAWGFGGVFSLFANLVHLNCALCLPLVLLGAEALVQRRSPGRIAFFALVTALALNGGNPQPLIALGLLLLPRFLIFAPGGPRARLTLLGGLAAAAGIAALMNGPAIMLLVDLLGHSANRTLFAIEARLEGPGLLAFAAPPLPIGAETYGIIHQPQFWYLGALPFLLVVAAASRALLHGDRRDRGLLAGLLLFGLLVAGPLGGLLGSVPILGGLNWTKYVAAAQLLGLVLAARYLDRLAADEKRARQHLSAIATLLLGWCLLLVRGPDGGVQGPWFVLGAAIPGALLLLLWADRVQLRLVLPLLVLAELVVHLPAHPPRPPEPLARWPEALAELSRDPGAPDEQPLVHREAAYRDAAPPMVSGLLGWHDVRTVTPLPLLDYHRFMSPWINCGPWPPYLLLGASREFVLSPAFDHVGLRWLLLREDDFNSVVRSPKAELLENEAVIRFGELQRALRYGGLDTGSLLNLDPYRSSILLAPDRRFSAELDLAAASAEIAFSLQALDGGAFRARGRLADQTIELDQDRPAQAVVIADAREPVVFSLDLEAGSPVTLRFDHWQVARHITKGRFDFDDRSTPAMSAAGLRLLENRYPLPIARAVKRARLIRDPEEFWPIHRAFVADGSGWQPREETFIVAPTGNLPSAAVTDTRPDASDRLELRRRGFGRMVLETDLKQAGPVFLAIAYDPGWLAVRDGRELPIRRADGAFIAIDLDRPGPNRVDFEYRPRAFDRGLVLVAAGTLLLLALGLLEFRSRLRSGVRAS